METVIGIAGYVIALSFFGWCFWVLDEKHPERLEKLQRAWAPIDRR